MLLSGDLRVSLVISRATQLAWKRENLHSVGKVMFSHLNGTAEQFQLGSFLIV